MRSPKASRSKCTRRSSWSACGCPQTGGTMCAWDSEQRCETAASSLTSRQNCRKARFSISWSMTRATIWRPRSAKRSMPPSPGVSAKQNVASWRRLLRSLPAFVRDEPSGQAGCDDPAGGSPNLGDRCVVARASRQGARAVRGRVGTCVHHARGLTRDREAVSGSSRGSAATTPIDTQPCVLCRGRRSRPRARGLGCGQGSWARSNRDLRSRCREPRRSSTRGDTLDR
jgi:hypothetical protein